MNWQRPLWFLLSCSCICIYTRAYCICIYTHAYLLLVCITTLHCFLWLSVSRKLGFNLCGLTPTSTLKIDYEVLSSRKLKIAKWNAIKTNEFYLAWCQKWEKLHILHAFRILLHGNISKPLIIVSGDFRSHVLHSLTHTNHRSGTPVLISIIFDTILLSSVGSNVFYTGSWFYEQFNNTALKLNICIHTCKTALSFSGCLLLIVFPIYF